MERRQYIGTDSALASSFTAAWSFFLEVRNVSGYRFAIGCKSRAAGYVMGEWVTRHIFNRRITWNSRYKCSRYKERKEGVDDKCDTIKYMTINSFLTTSHHPPDPAPQPPSFWMSADRCGFIPTGSGCPNPAEGGAFL